MRNISWMSEYDGEVKTLELTRNPFHSGLGNYKDIHGKLWDINTIINGYVCAREIRGQSYYGTSSYDSQEGIHTWLPYKVKVVDEG